MERRKFLQITATGTGGMLLLPHFLWANSFFGEGDKLSENKLIFIQLMVAMMDLTPLYPSQTHCIIAIALL